MAIELEKEGIKVHAVDPLDIRAGDVLPIFVRLGLRHVRR